MSMGKTVKRVLLKIFFIWACVYPLVMLSLLGLRALDLHLSIGVQSLVLTIVLVPLMTLYIVPLVNRVTRGSQGDGEPD